jgi:NodT family efflux transporter outer membrane factor (OMF) lipoprotein
MKRCVLPLLALASCSVGPDYAPPPAATPVAFKELAGWTPASPRDGIEKGAWWSVFHDRQLDALERQVAVTNQNVAAAEAAYRQATELVREAQAGLFPTLDVTPQVTRQSFGGSSSSGFGSSSGFSAKNRTRTQYSLEGNASWTVDVWGRIRRQVESEQAAAQVSAADLANATLAAQAALATDYFELRFEDSLMRLLSDTVGFYRRSLQIAQNQYDAGTASRADVVVAEAQLRTAEAQLAGVGVQRAEFEHAIAVLTGHAPAELAIPPSTLATEVPVVPAGVPSALLERRPDIAAAERGMAEQNAQIGVAIAAYYPDITLTAAYGYAGDPLSKLFTVANRVWSLGAAGSETVLDGGLRTATVAAARAGYDASVASYRQTVLTAFQQVEDDLSSLRILQQQAAVEDAAVAATRRAVEVTLNEYRAGTVAYTSVVTEQAQLLGNQQAALAIQESRMLASVALIQALGGGWQAADLPGKVKFDPVAAVLP